jgi:hypothetical protein
VQNRIQNNFQPQEQLHRFSISLSVYSNIRKDCITESK